MSNLLLTEDKKTRLKGKIENRLPETSNSYEVTVRPEGEVFIYIEGTYSFDSDDEEREIISKLAGSILSIGASEYKLVFEGDRISSLEFALKRHKW